MKYFVIFLLCCVAFATAAPQLLTWPGYTAGFGYAGYPGYTAPFSRTLVTGPTVVNGFGGRYVAPGFVY